MRRILMLIVIALTSVSLTACGGKGGSKDGPSAYAQLEGFPATLDAEVDKVMSPIDSVDKVLTQMKELPEKLKLSKEDFGKLITDTLAGKPFAAPAGVDATGAAELEGFLTNFKTFQEGIVNAPANAEALVKFVGASAIDVPKWAATAIAEATVAKNNPFASKADKAEAEKQLGNMDTIKNMVMAKVQETQTKATTLPARAVEASTKFAAAMTEMGIASAGAAVDAGKDKAKVK